jgi:hypothetical protein
VVRGLWSIGVIYVDKLPEQGWGKWNGGAHMLGTDLDELHAVAQTIGLRRAWFQGRTTFAHYDLTASKRRQVLRLHEVVEIDLGEIPDDVLMRCHDGSYEQRHVRLARLKREASRDFVRSSHDRAEAAHSQEPPS